MLKSSKGLSLIELISVIAIIIILSALSYPTYLSSRMETRRSDATTYLHYLKNVIENYLMQNHKVTFESADFNEENGYFTNYASGSSQPILSNSNFYRITITPGNSTTNTLYSIMAEAIVINEGSVNNCNSSNKVQCRDKNCRKLILSQTNNQTSLNNNDGASSGCWD